ncbi:MAG TPA: hypothetical protein VGM92_12850 [Candidatus Kapabacteria bacterium]|jgi:hypothetical protein
MNASQILVVVLQASIALILGAVWIVFFYYLFKKWRRRKTETGSLIPPVVYGAWQGHNLGTTIMEPGDMREIERDLKKATSDK